MPGMFDAVLGESRSSAMIPGVSPEMMKRAVAMVTEQGKPVNRVNIMEALAVLQSEGAGESMNTSMPGKMGERRAPEGSAEQRAEQAIERKRQAGPPAWMLKRQGMLLR